MIENDQQTSIHFQDEAENMRRALELFDALVPYCSNRTQHVLTAYRQSFPNDSIFIYNFFNLTWKAARGLKNAGKKTADEIISFKESLIVKSGYNAERTTSNEKTTFTIPEGIDKLFPLVETRLKFLSVRARNALRLFFKEHNNSLKEWYSTVTSPAFNVIQIKNIGKKTIEEVLSFINDLVEFIRQFTDEESIEDALTDYIHPLDELQIPREHQTNLHHLEKALGHLPLFAVIKVYFSNLDEESRLILDSCFRIHPNQKLGNRELVSPKLGVSPERVRQKRNKLADSLATYFSSIRTVGFIRENPYSYQMTQVNEMINETEGTDYSLNFVNWVLGCTFDNITIVGKDYNRALFSFYETDAFIGLVPTALCHLFDFPAFVEDISNRLSLRRTDEEKVSLREIIYHHLKTQYCEDEMPSIETACRSLLYLHYPVEVDSAQIIFKPNARKNNPFVIEDIIRAAGHPLTMEEIYEEFLSQYPERFTEMNSLRGGINNNPNIVPIGRSGTYSLVEWQNGEQRGGTIRQFVCEYLDSLDNPIASLDEITQYVLKHRPLTNRSKILTNLSAERSGCFSQYIKDRKRYIAYSKYKVDESFLPAELTKTAKSFKENLDDLKVFIAQKRRAPIHASSDFKELHLYRFLSRARKRVRDNDLTVDERNCWDALYEEYKEIIIPDAQGKSSL